MITLAITNQKGGVGKTTTTFHLARALQRRGLRTLVVDLDPQSNISVALSAQPLEDGQAGLAHALSQHSDLTVPDVVVSTVWDRVHLVPAGGDALAGVRNELVIAAGPRGAPWRATRSRYRAFRCMSHRLRPFPGSAHLQRSRGR